MLFVCVIMIMSLNGLKEGEMKMECVALMYFDVFMIGNLNFSLSGLKRYLEGWLGNDVLGGKKH